ncbi:hypothetical protein C0J45_3731, partial [Silurus meridionalis]
QISDSSSSPEKPDGPTSGQSKVEVSSTVTLPDRIPRIGGDAKPEPAQRSRGSGPTPTSPKPPIQSAKPSLGPRPALPQKPRSSSTRNMDESSESSGGGQKVPPALRKVPWDKDGSLNPPQSTPGSKNSTQEDASVYKLEPELEKTAAHTAEEAETERERRTSLSRPVRRTSSSNQQSSDESGSKVKDKSAEKDKDSSQSSKSADSGEEADKDFIFI